MFKRLDTKDFIKIIRENGGADAIREYCKSITGTDKEMPTLMIEEYRDMLIKNDISSDNKKLFKLVNQNPVEYREFLKLSISGFDNDSRELYEIPFVRKWFNDVANKYPSLLYAFDLDTLRLFIYMCSTALPDNKVAMDIKRVTATFNKTIDDLVSRELVSESDAKEWFSEVLSYIQNSTNTDTFAKTAKAK